MINSCLYPSSPLPLLFTEATEGATKGLVSQSPRLVSYQVFKCIARREGGSRAVPAAVQSKLSPVAAPLRSEPQPAPAAVTERVGGKQITVCPSPVSSPEYFPLHNTAQGQGAGICSLSVFFQFDFHNLVIRHPTPSHFCGLTILHHRQKKYTCSQHLPLFFHLCNSKKQYTFES